MDRPQNPFTRIDESDWKASQTALGGSHALKHDKLKDQNSHRLSPTSDWSQPLPLDTSQDFLRQEVVALRGPNSKNSSQSSVGSMTSNLARKTAPPIPKKPTLLSNQQHSQESRYNAQGKSRSSRPPSGGINAKPIFPSPPQRIKQQEIYGQRPTESVEPPLPPRNTGATIAVSSELMDSGIEGASAIPSLQPMRRQQ